MFSYKRRKNEAFQATEGKWGWIADEDFEEGTGESGDGCHMRMGLCNMIESSEEIGEVRRKKNFICEWEKAQRGNGAQVEAASYRKGWGLLN